MNAHLMLKAGTRPSKNNRIYGKETPRVHEGGRYREETPAQGKKIQQNMASLQKWKSTEKKPCRILTALNPLCSHRTILFIYSYIMSECIQTTLQAMSLTLTFVVRLYLGRFLLNETQERVIG